CEHCKLSDSDCLCSSWCPERKLLRIFKNVSFRRTRSVQENLIIYTFLIETPLRGIMGRYCMVPLFSLRNIIIKNTMNSRSPGGRAVIGNKEPGVFKFQ